MIRVVFGVGLLAVLPSLALAGSCPPAALPNNCDGDAFDDDEDLCPFDASAQNLPTAITYLNTDTPLPTGAACTAAGVEVELGAVLGFGVALRTGARVFRGARVGDFATVGGGSEDAIVGARARIASATAPQTGVEFPSGSLQRRAYVGFDPADVPQLSLQGDVVFGERVSVSRSVTIGHGARIGNDVVIGYGATIGPGAEIASGAVIGALAVIEADTKVGANSVLARGVVLGATSEIGDSVVVGPDVVIGTGSRIGDVGGAAVRIRKSVQIGNNTRIEPGARIGRDANVLADSSVLAGVTLGARVTVEEGAIACSDAAPPAGATCAPGGFYRSGGTVFASDSGGGGTSCSAPTGPTYSLVATLDDPFPTPQVFPSGGGNGDRFGRSVAVDGNCVFVGDFAHNLFSQDDGTLIGRAHRFDTDGTLLHTYQDPTPGSGQYAFGIDVTVDGDRMLVGTTGTSGAYLLDVATGAVLQQFLDPTPDVSATNFGVSVALQGNYVLVGDPNDDTAGTNIGQAHLFDATTGAFIRTLDDPTPSADNPITGGPDGDRFGTSVALSGDFVIVGAPIDQTIEPQVGQAYVFSASTGALVHILNDPTPTSDGANGDRFGTSISANGDQVLIGAPWDGSVDPTNNPQVGQAHLFDLVSGSLLQTYNDPTVGEFYSNDGFGTSVSLRNGVALIGAPYDRMNTPGFGIGEAHLFNAQSGQLLHTFNDPTPTGWDGFGTQVTLGENVLVVGVPYDNTLGPGVGQAHIYTYDAAN